MPVFSYTLPTVIPEYFVTAKFLSLGFELSLNKAISLSNNALNCLWIEQEQHLSSKFKIAIPQHQNIIINKSHFYCVTYHHTSSILRSRTSY